MTRARSARAPAAWLLEPGPETCEFCARAFHLELGYHCVDCDRPVCPICVVTVRARSIVVCPECPSGRRA